MQDCNHEEEHACAAQRAKDNMPAEEKIISLATAFKAISEPSRLKILFALRQGEMCVYHITEAVGGTQSAVSHQLRILRDTTGRTLSTLWRMRTSLPCLRLHANILTANFKEFQ